MSNFSEYIFRTVPSDSVAAKALANYMLKELKKKNAAVFYSSESDYSKSLKFEFEKFLREEGGKVSREFDLSKLEFNGEQSIEEAIKGGAEVLVLLSNTGELDDTLEVVKANKKRLPLLGGDDLYTPKFLKEGADDAVGMVIAVPWHILASQHNFLESSRNLWKNDVNWRTAMSYDATIALIEALKKNSDLTDKAPSTIREELAKTLRSQDFTAKGATGEIKFESGDRSQKYIQLVTIIRNSESRSGFGYDFVPAQPLIVKSSLPFARLRKDSNITAGILKEVPNGTYVTIIDIKSVEKTKDCGELWYKIQVDDKVGWMCADLLEWKYFPE